LISLTQFLGCAVAIPVHEAETPETLGQWGFRIGLLVGSAPALGVPSSIIGGGDPQTDESALEGLKLAVGILPNVDLGFEGYAGAFTTADRFSLKYQFMGPDFFASDRARWSGSLAFRYGNAAGTDLTFANGIYRVYAGTLAAKTYELSNIWGYRFAKIAGFYAAPKIIYSTIRADYTFSDGGPVVTSTSRSVTGAGTAIGLHLSPHSEHLGIEAIIEYQLMNFPATFSDDREWYSSFMLAFNIPFRFN
jgi:hypothetical protein